MVRVAEAAEDLDMAVEAPHQIDQARRLRWTSARPLLLP